MTEDEMVGWHQRLHGHEFEQALEIGDGHHRNLECQVHESRQIGSGQTRDGKSECRPSRNQRTETDWNG